MKINKYPTKEILRDIFSYDGYNLRWRKNRANNKIKKDSVAGFTDTSGYRQCRIEGCIYMIHRLIWIYHYNDISNSLIIDHRDRDSLNNNIYNLRLVTRQENCFNTNARGYHWDKRKNKWSAIIGINGKSKWLGYYNNKDDARQAYLDAKLKYHKIEERI